ncbi:IS1182 family transposase [Clostridium sp. FP1]|uniref:IS1182 family transposase n=1 Tax=Clostridium sp. FP1 TaxID=2724076 RepID=UPI001CC945C8|nr:IS1182 family transposase [Clostridium sp. FP1]MBZ9632823.1 IS1182 family transposase [Clostridium sp. FP1]MBZ9634796.1 IS1182 family transposase [Clostridium sp. FP1]MBZ9637286.1 IS1182 family transposase [Clostridium sp. FP1]
MINKEITQKNYTNNCEVYQLVFPIETGILIPEDDSVRLLSQILEELYYKNLNEAYSSQGRKPAVEPKILFKILVYAYMNDIYSSRKIEKACKRDINFMWLLQGRKAPDHNTIARFRSKRLVGVVDDLFNQLVEKLKTYGEVEFKNIFIDGTKIEANANKYTFVWKKSTDKFQAKLQEKIKEIIEKINFEFKTEYIISEPEAKIEYLQEILKFLNKNREHENIEFVHGQGKRKTKIQKFIENLSEFIEKQKKYDDYTKTFDGRNSFSKTDKDSTFMHMKEDHMRNSQLKPGYNMQIGVEGEYIVGIDISSERSDQLTFIPFLKKLRETLSQIFDSVIADAGYESEENYMYLESTGQNTFIKPQTYESMKKRSFKNNISKRENMNYDEVNDEYTCHNNKKLKVLYNTIRKSKSGYKASVTVYECEDCDSCQYKPKCTKAKGNKRLSVSKKFIQKRLKSLENITSLEGIMLRTNRSIQVEGAFGVLKEDHGFRRFLTKGKINVKTEFTLLCFGYNINKFHNKIQNDRCGILLHEIKSA